MPQDPLLVDQISIEPGSAGTRTINRAADGSLQFTDSLVSNITLSQLASLRAITNVALVGKSGAGAEHTTIQAALDLVPANASPTNPYAVVVLPGRYDETINISRDGVHLIGLGQPEIRSALEATPDAVGNDHTLIISAQGGTTPQFCFIEGFKISNAHAGKACVRVVGAAASTLLGGSQGLYLRNCDLLADSAAGNRPLWATAANDVYADRVKFGGSVLSTVKLEEMSDINLRECFLLVGFDSRYDTAQDEPAGGNGFLSIINCVDMCAGTNLVPAMALDCDGAGVVEIRNCTMPNDVRIQFSGGLTHSIQNSLVGDISLLETVTVNMLQSRHQGVVAANANAVLDTDNEMGTATFVAATTQAVVFGIPRADTTYSVSLETDSQPANDEAWWITNKLATGFTINFASNQTLSARWRVAR